MASVAAPGASMSYGSRIGRIVRRRDVLLRLIGADIKIKYEGSTLGYVWSILEPLMLTGVYFIFISILGVGRQVPDYPLFLIAGILPWQWVQQSVNQGARALTDYAKLITKVYVPREIYPLSVVGAKSFEYVLSVLIVFAIAGLYQRPPSVYLAAMPLAWLLQLILLTGISFVLSVANTLFNDIARIIRPFLRAWFYVSPILYPLEKVMESHAAQWMKLLYRLNPMVGILELYHAAWYPESFRGWSNVGISAAGALLIALFGWVLFTRLENACLKEL